MKKLKKNDYIILLCILLIIGVIVFATCFSKDGEAAKSGSAETVSSEAVSEPKAFDGRIMGIKVGSSFEQPTMDYFPNSQYSYLDTDTDLMTALKTGKIDGFLQDEPIAKMTCIENLDLAYFKTPLFADDYHFGFQKQTESSKILMSQFNEMINDMWSKGDIDKLITKWLEGPENEKIADESGLTGENGELLVAVLSDYPPFSYYLNNKLTGYVIDLTTEFARRYGYSIKYEETKIASMVAGLSTGKYDIAATGLSYTEERAKSIDFSDVIYKGGMMLMTRAEDVTGPDIITYSTASSDTDEEKGFFKSMADSFEKNFVKEDRWKLILQGIGTTCAITALTVLFGSILAFLICMFRRTDSILAEKICNIYVKLLQGTPMIVLLMILYYVVFGKSGFDALWVAVIGFSLNFGAYGSEIMRSGIESIDNGQREAALALGFTENQGFFKFIFPQAAVRFLPVYRGEIISLLKNTSIVGYIAIQDLTKMSDIIRSRTFEAFFPLIATAVIYFILAWIISFALAKVLKVVDPKQNKKTTVKGVTVK